MRIYITNLSQYNAGRLIGEWVELPCSEEELQDALSRALGKDEEYFITATEDTPFTISEHGNVYKINEMTEEHEALESSERLSVSFLLSEGYSFKYSLENHEDILSYPDDSLEDVAHSLVQDGSYGEIPESLSNYIDYSAIARDLEHEGYVERAEGVFYAN